MQNLSPAPVENAPPYPGLFHTLLCIALYAAWLPFCYPDQLYKMVGYQLTGIPSFWTLKAAVGAVFLATVLSFLAKAFAAERGRY